MGPQSVSNVLITLVLSMVYSLGNFNVFAASTITPKEADQLIKLKELLTTDDTRHFTQDYMKTDLYLLGWLRKDGLGPEKAAMRIREAMQWRQEHQVDKVLEEDFKMLNKTCVFDVDGSDKEGRQVFIFLLGRCDFRRIVITGKTEEYYRYTNYILERLQKQIHTLNNRIGNNQTDHLMVIDMNGYNFKQHTCIRCIPLNRGIEVALKTYPTKFYKAFVINTPQFVAAAKEIFAEKNWKGDKVQVIANDVKEISAALKEYVSDDQLPIRYGGTRRM